jgi:hypothetical protein
MNGSPLKQYVVIPVALSAAVFGTLTLPLTILGSKPVTIQIQEEPVFHGQLRDVAAPYLGLATALSLGVGVASIAVTGWRQSTRKSSQVQAQLSGLAQNLQEKEAQLEALKLSESSLAAAGLREFVDEEVPLEQLKNTKEVSFGEVPIVEAVVIKEQPFEPQPMVVPNLTVQAAASQFACAQPFLGYSQVKAAIKPAPQTTLTASSEVEQLRAQLQQIMAQMAYVQMTLSTKGVMKTSETPVPANSVQLEGVKPWSVHEIAS